MNKTSSKIFFSAAAALLALATAYAESTDEFIAELARIEAGDGADKAYETLTNRLATTKPEALDAAKCDAELVKLLVATGKSTNAEKVIVEKLLPSSSTTAAIALPALKKYANESKRPPMFRQNTLQAALKSPCFAAKDLARAELLRMLATTYVNRSFCDLAAEMLDEAATCTINDPEYKANLLFQAASVAQDMRDVDKAGKLFHEIQEIPGLPYAVARKALLKEGMNYIFIDQYDWVPQPDRLEKADELIHAAINAKPQAIKFADAFQARLSLMKAYHKAKNYDKAIEIGMDLVDNKPPKARDLPIYTTALSLADLMTEARKYKLAIRYYEKALEGHVEPKNTNKKIGTAARRAGDYARAIQAYTDALPFCDWVEGKDEIEQLKRMAAVLSRAIRGKAKATSAEELFSEESEDITNLQLDDI